jgi:hypothetical protein
MKQMPQRVKDRIDKLTGELKRIYALAEQNWEGCDGCDENDKYFWMNGFQTGYNVKSAEQPHNPINIEEIPKEEQASLRNTAYKHFDIDGDETEWIKYTEKDMRAAFQAGNRYGKSESKPHRTMHWERFIEVYNETLETADKKK